VTLPVVEVLGVERVPDLMGEHEPIVGIRHPHLVEIG
jgi:hypothetical protein